MNKEYMLRQKDICKKCLLAAVYPHCKRNTKEFAKNIIKSCENFKSKEVHHEL